MRQREKLMMMMMMMTRVTKVIFQTERVLREDLKTSHLVGTLAISVSAEEGDNYFGKDNHKEPQALSKPLSDSHWAGGQV